MMLAATIHLAVVLGIYCSIICRARHMGGETKAIVKWQHALLAIGALYSLVVPADWSAVSIGVGIIAFLALGAPRWHHDAPPGTAKPPRPSLHNPWAKS